jgi:hypothetical protein
MSWPWQPAILCLLEKTAMVFVGLGLHVWRQAVSISALGLHRRRPRGATPYAAAAWWWVMRIWPVIHLLPVISGKEINTGVTEFNCGRSSTRSVFVPPWTCRIWKRSRRARSPKRISTAKCLVHARVWGGEQDDALGPRRGQSDTAGRRTRTRAGRVRGVKARLGGPEVGFWG